jgi:hypothetical protein
MGILDKLKWRLDSVKALASLFSKWRPRNCETEKDYENSLASFLHKELEDHQITPQYAKGRFHADLVIDDRLIIEIKYNLNTTAKYQRLLGQLAEYKEWPGQVVLLLVGKTDPNLRKQLTAYLKKEGFCGGMFPVEEDKVTVYEK